jgi:hypothetical protein
MGRGPTPTGVPSKNITHLAHGKEALLEVQVDHFWSKTKNEHRTIGWSDLNPVLVGIFGVGAGICTITSASSPKGEDGSIVRSAMATPLSRATRALLINDAVRPEPDPTNNRSPSPSAPIAFSSFSEVRQSSWSASVPQCHQLVHYRLQFIQLSATEFMVGICASMPPTGSLSPSALRRNLQCQPVREMPTPRGMPLRHTNVSALGGGAKA